MATSSVRAAESLLRFELFSFSRILFSASSFLLFLSCSTRKHLLLTRVAQSKFYCEFDSLLHRFYSSYHVQFPPPRKHLFLTRVAQSVVASLEEEIPHWRKLQKSSTGELLILSPAEAKHCSGSSCQYLGRIKTVLQLLPLCCQHCNCHYCHYCIPLC